MFNIVKTYFTLKIIFLHNLWITSLPLNPVKLALFERHLIMKLEGMVSITDFIN